MKRLVTLLACCCALTQLQAVIIQFELSPPGTDQAVGLNGLNEAPIDVITTASGGEAGSGITYNTDTGQLSIDVFYFGLSSPYLVSHIHAPAPPGQTAPPIINLNPVHTPFGGSTAGRISGTFSLSEAQEEDLLGNLHYINIHSDNFPNGELRAQLIPVDVTPVPEPEAYAMAASLGLLAFAGWRSRSRKLKTA